MILIKSDCAHSRIFLCVKRAKVAYAKHMHGKNMRSCIYAYERNVFSHIYLLSADLGLWRVRIIEEV